jgi:hypothetical protein
MRSTPPAFDSRFAHRWENKLQGQMVCVCGSGQEYQDKPEILLTNHAQSRVEVLGVPYSIFCPWK